MRFYHPMREGSYRRIEATVGKLSEGFPASVVLILRPISGPLPAPMQPAVSCSPAIPPAYEERDSIILSHGRRIPLTENRLDTSGGEPAPR